MSLKFLDAVIVDKLKSTMIELPKEDSLSIEESVKLQLEIASEFIERNKENITVDLSSHYNQEPFILNDDRRFRAYLEDIIFKHLSIYLKNIYIRLFNKDDKAYQKSLNNFYEYCQLATYRLECHACGESLALYFDYDSMTIKPALEESCMFNNVSKHHSMDLDLSCGQLLVANDMRVLFGDQDKQRKIEREFESRRNQGHYISVNNTFGRMLNTEMWAENNMMYFQTGNTSPNYYFNEAKNYLVFRDPFEEWEEYKDEAPDTKNLPFAIEVDNEKYLGYICTDLWAINAISMDTFKKLCEENNLNEEEMIRKLDIKIHNVKKGVYQCITFYETADDIDMCIYHAIEYKC